MNFYRPFFLIIVVSFLLAAQGRGQSISFDPMAKVKKPEKYENKKLPSERTGEKSFKGLRKFIQNNTTRYNYYFNANEKLSRVVERAKMGYEDDYLNLLSFYPFTLDNTKSQATELDSVIYHSTAGILLHDLRSDWVDNLYLLIGKAYYFRQQFDSSELTFQFINYNLQPRNSDEDRKVVGSIEQPGSGFSIADKESSNIYKKIFKLQPSRNEALVWLVRNAVEQNDFASAAGLINILKNDPQLPERLNTTLAEVTAYYFFKQEMYDSTAPYLEKALTGVSGQERGRWEYLAAQLNEQAGNYEKASHLYSQATRHATDPLLAIFSELSQAKMMRNDGNENELETTIAALEKMAMRERYDAYKDIIYYSTASLALRRPDTVGAVAYLNRSLSNNFGNQVYKNRAFYQLANLFYGLRDYKAALNNYDSLDYTNNEFSVYAQDLDIKKANLQKLVYHVSAIQREDSLQRIAAMSNDDREIFIKDVLKRYEKEQRVKAAIEGADVGTFTTAFEDRNAPAELFTRNEKGGWYFINKSALTTGNKEFVRRWGRREDRDSWRRSSAGMLASSPNTLFAVDPDMRIDTVENAAFAPLVYNDIYDYDAMLANLPMTTARLDSSFATIAENLISKGNVLQYDLEDYTGAINAFEEYLQRFPDGIKRNNAYMGMYYSYTKLGQANIAQQYKLKILADKEGSVYKDKFINPEAFLPNKISEKATQAYEGIYNKFIEGNFGEAFALKKVADSTYGNNYWTPQLLYIEAVYHIRNNNDSNAVRILESIPTLFPTSNLAEKAKTMVDVVMRRAAIQDYLTNLEVTRAEEDVVMMAQSELAKQTQVIVKKEVDNQVVKEAAIKTPVVSGTIKIPEIYKLKNFVLNPNDSQMVIMILDKVDAVYINEAKNAMDRYNRGSMATQQIKIQRDLLDAEKALLVFSAFEDASRAITYYDRLKKAAPSEISWLQPAKYSFLIISRENFELLKENKDLDSYRQLLNKNFDNRFLK